MHTNEWFCAKLNLLINLFGWNAIRTTTHRQRAYINRPCWLFIFIYYYIFNAPELRNEMTSN